MRELMAADVPGAAILDETTTEASNDAEGLLNEERARKGIHA
jgi:hypothetical protein